MGQSHGLPDAGGALGADCAAATPARPKVTAAVNNQVFLFMKRSLLDGF
jgi:hypothetical protein